MLGGSLDGKGVWENRCMYMYGPVSLLCTRSYHNFDNRLLKKKIHSYHHHFVLEKKNFRHLKCYKNVSDQIRSVAQSCPTLCDPMNRSTPGFPVHHQLRSNLRCCFLLTWLRQALMGTCLSYNYYHQSYSYGSCYYS